MVVLKAHGQRRTRKHAPRTTGRAGKKRPQPRKKPSGKRPAPRGPALPVAPTELTELPSSYGRTRLTLMEIEPHWVYAYWEIMSQDIRQASHRLGAEKAGSQWVLRFYDVTGLKFHGDSVRGYFDVSIDLAPGNWYVNLWSSGKCYYVEIGLRSAAGRFVSLCRSNTVEVPSAGPSTAYGAGWLKAEGAANEIEDTPESLARARSSKSDREEAPSSVAPRASHAPAAGENSSHSLYFSQVTVSQGALSSEGAGSLGLETTRITQRKREMREANERKSARTRRREGSEKA